MGFLLSVAQKKKGKVHPPLEVLCFTNTFSVTLSASKE